MMNISILSYGGWCILDGVRVLVMGGWLHVGSQSVKWRRLNAKKRARALHGRQRFAHVFIVRTCSDYIRTKYYPQKSTPLFFD